jgi:large subunit ribosomal protein L3
MKIKGTKLYMTQVWEDIEVKPVTIVKVEDEKIFDLIEKGDKIILSGKSKGRGFQGVVKRHGFHGADKTHGTKHHVRAPGSIGDTNPQRVYPGKKMAGRMGQEKVTIKNVKIVDLRPEKMEILIKGAVPGMKGSKVEIKIKSQEK